MYNDITRKLTSLTLMTVMLAGGMVIAYPGFTPTASAEVAKTANLYVSSVNFGGPMVLEIIVDDKSINETDEAKGQPNVTIDGLGNAIENTDFAGVGIYTDQEDTTIKKLHVKNSLKNMKC